MRFFIIIFFVSFFSFSSFANCNFKDTYACDILDYLQKISNQTSETIEATEQNKDHMLQTAAENFLVEVNSYIDYIENETTGECLQLKAGYTEELHIARKDFENEYQNTLKGKPSNDYSDSLYTIDQLFLRISLIFISWC